MDNKILLIKTSDIYPNPDNPRKDVGDVSELAESIKANGIMQNLTVVPMEGKDTYYALIGHRRLAAAKLAGLTEVPCTVTDLDRREQIAVMLAENMQRKDLTPLEEADSMQLMLDMGSTVTEISEKTGLSETTVRRRIKLLDYDRDELEKSFERNVRLEDYDELNKIKSPERRMEVLKAIGTNNFNYLLRSMINYEKREDNFKRAKAWIDKQGIEEIKKIDYDKVSYCQNLSNFDENNPPELPLIEEEGKYYYYVDGMYIYLYKDKPQITRTESPENNNNNNSYEKKRRRKEKLDKINADMFECRKKWVHDLASIGNGITGERNALRTLARFFVKYNAGSCFDIDYELLAEVMNFDISDCEDNETASNEISRCCCNLSGALQSKLMLAAIYACLDNGNTSYYTWSGEYCGDDTLDAVYELIEEFGYKKSDEETAICSGTHELFCEDKE